MRTARFQTVDGQASSLYSTSPVAVQSAGRRDRRFPAGWWIFPSVLPGLALLIWAIAKLF